MESLQAEGVTILADYRALMDQVGAFAAAGDYASALNTCLQARAKLAQIPDVESSAGEKATFERDLAGLEAALRSSRGDDGVTTRRNAPQFATITPIATGSGE